MEALVFVFIDCECILIRRSAVDGVRFLHLVNPIAIPTSHALPVIVCPTKLLTWVLYVGVGVRHAAPKRALLDLRVTRAILGLRLMQTILCIRLTRAILRAAPRTGSFGTVCLLTRAIRGVRRGVNEAIAQRDPR